MIWTITKREFTAHILSLNFSVCLLLSVILTALSSLLLTADYAKRLADYDTGVSQSAEELRRTKVYSLLRPRLHRPPQPLSILAEGVDRKAGVTLTLSPREVPVRLVGGRGTNEFAVVFPVLDFVGTVTVILSLLALLLSYDRISGEKEQGTLRLSLATPCPRHQLLLGKYLGGILALAIPLTMGLLIGLLVALVSPSIHLNALMVGKTCLLPGRSV